MDIQEIRGSENEHTYTPSAQAPRCPGCSADIVAGDRFCQECGTRVSTNRTKRSAVREKNNLASADDIGSASIICINCGTTNKALSTVCCDCKIPLIPRADQPEESQRTELNGLRGSLTIKARRQALNAPLRSEQVNRNSDRLPSSEKVENQAPENSAAQENPGTLENATSGSHGTARDQVSDANAGERKTFKQRLPRFLTGNTANKNDRAGDDTALDFLYPAADTFGRSPVTEPFEKMIAETRNTGNIFSLSTIIVSIESLFERIPTPFLFLVLSFIIICITVNATTQWNRYEQRLIAIDKIAINAENKMLAFQLDDAINTLQELERTEKGDLPPRARAVLNQSLWLRSYSNAKQLQYAKAIADLSSVTSAFISFDDVTAKLAEYKKLLASHPEFADGLSTKKKNSNKRNHVANDPDGKRSGRGSQGNAVSGKSRSEGLAGGFRNGLERNPRANGLEGSSRDRLERSSQANGLVGSSRNRLERSSQAHGLAGSSRDGLGQGARSPVSERSAPGEVIERRSSGRDEIGRGNSLEGSTAPLKTKRRNGARDLGSRGESELPSTDETDTSKGSGAQPKVHDIGRIGASPGRNGENIKGNEKRRVGRSDASLLDNDMKRYSGLLVDYFSKAELSRASGEKLAEPPSYEEWSEGGKRVF